MNVISRYSVDICTKKSLIYYCRCSGQDLESHILLINVETGCGMAGVNLEGTVNSFTGHLVNQNRELRVSEAL